MKKPKQGRPRKYDFNMKVLESRQYDCAPETLRSAAWYWSQSRKGGRWKYVVSADGRITRVR